MSRPEQEADRYWTADVVIGEAPLFRGETFIVRMRLHTSTEPFRGRHEIVPLRQPVGERIYVHGTPYILVPEITLTVALAPHPEPSGAIGEITGSDWTGMRHEAIGQAQAWYYPADQLVILWECFPEAGYRRAERADEDPLLATLWEGFEHWLVTEQFPAARQLVTTWEDLYDRRSWAAFLAERGYEQVAPAAFVKDPR